jgi:hypothetical protein
METGRENGINDIHFFDPVRGMIPAGHYYLRLESDGIMVSTPVAIMAP